MQIASFVSGFLLVVLSSFVTREIVMAQNKKHLDDIFELVKKYRRVVRDYDVVAKEAISKGLELAELLEKRTDELEQVYDRLEKAQAIIVKMEEPKKAKTSKKKTYGKKV